VVPVDETASADIADEVIVDELASEPPLESTDTESASEEPAIVITANPDEEPEEEVESGAVTLSSPYGKSAAIIPYIPVAPPPPPGVGGSESIRVVVRVRPLNSKEVKNGEEAAVGIDPERTEITIPGAPTFTFDHVFGADATQEGVYSACASMVVAGCLEGYNGAVFAYGQTGSGKTWSMQGNADNPGIIPRTFRQDAN